MLRASVSLSRKVTHDYNSTGFTVTLDGEVPFPISDNEGVLEKVSELFHLADEALQIEMQRDKPQEKPTNPVSVPAKQPATNGQYHGPANPANTGRTNPANTGRTNPAPQTNGTTHNPNELATPKQLQFLQTMAKRCKLSDRQIDARINEVIGRSCAVQQLSKKEMGLVLDSLTNGNVRTGG